MPNVQISTACFWNGRRREAGEVINVDDRTAELNAAWMTETTAAVTPDAPAADTQKKTGKADKESN